MKNAIMLHGTSCRPDSFWFPSIKRFLENRGYEVWAPALPQPDAPDLTVQLPFIMKNGMFSEETIIIGHSAGVPLALAVLEQSPLCIRKAILVAGFARPLGKEGDHAAIVKEYDWQRVREHVAELFVINSDNDPWGCTDREGKYITDRTGGTLIILYGEGHMGSDAFQQPYKEFPLLQRLL